MDIFIYSHHLPSWYCVDIVRRNAILVTHGRWSVKSSPIWANQKRTKDFAKHCHPDKNVIQTKNFLSKGSILPMYDALAVRVLYSDHRPWYTTALHSQSFYNHSTANAISKFVTLSFKRFTKGWRSSSVQCRNLNRITYFFLRGKGDLVTLKRFRPVRIHWIILVCNQNKKLIL